jgi:hypothetical protein
MFREEEGEQTQREHVNQRLETERRIGRHERADPRRYAGSDLPSGEMFHLTTRLRRHLVLAVLTTPGDSFVAGLQAIAFQDMEAL